MGNGDYRIIENLELNGHQKARITESVEELLAERELVRDFLPGGQAKAVERME